MYSLNHQYQNEEVLKNWLNEHQLTSKPHCLVQFFCGIPIKSMMDKIASMLTEQLPKAHIIGTTTDGEIISDEVTTQEIIISCSIFEKSVIDSCGLAYEESSFSLGRDLARELDGDDVRAMILFSTGLTIDGEKLLDGVQSVAEGKYIIAGGMAGDNASFKHTYVSHQKTILSNGVAGVALRGEALRVQNDYRFGWQAVGLPLRVTKADGNRVFEIEGESAVSIYEKYLGKQIADRLPKTAIELPFIVERNGVQIGRACQKKLDDGSLIFAGDIFEGEYVHFGIGDVDMILKEDRSLYRDTEAQFHPESIFVYSCMARRRLLKSDSSFELKRFAKHCTVGGFYTYGEFFSNQHDSYLLNETMTILALSESTALNDTPLITSNDEDNEKLNANDMVFALTHLTNMIASEWQERLDEEIAKNHEQEQHSFQQNKLAQMGEMVSMIAHQWRQPLNALSASAISLSLLSSMDKLDTKKVEESSRFIQDQCQKMSHTIDTFMNFVKPDRLSKPFKLAHTVNVIMQIMGTQLVNNNIEVSIGATDENISVVGYEDLLEQVILNILSNARDAFEELDIPGKRIDITIYMQGNSPVLAIKDNAGGIPELFREKIFNPYFTTKEQDKGTGIGLYMSLDIMRKSFKGDLRYIPIENGSRFDLVCGRG
ncbi:MAG: FIST N-terminal domain-containing protein [Campylobacterota bacterium]|nr:FIST N-terminal domain-containing protein [Campylobacterota bacterium]